MTETESVCSAVAGFKSCVFMSDTNANMYLMAIRFYCMQKPQIKYSFFPRKIQRTKRCEYVESKQTRTLKPIKGMQ